MQRYPLQVLLHGTDTRAAVTVHPGAEQCSLLQEVSVHSCLQASMMGREDSCKRRNGVEWFFSKLVAKLKGL